MYRQQFRVSRYTCHKKILSFFFFLNQPCENIRQLWMILKHIICCQIPRAKFLPFMWHFLQEIVIEGRNTRTTGIVWYDTEHYRIQNDMDDELHDGEVSRFKLIIFLHEIWYSGRTWQSYTLVEWNVLMYVNVTLPLTLVSNKLNVPFFTTIFQRDKYCYCFSVHFLTKLCQNCQKILEIISCKILTRTNIPVPSVILVLLHHNVVTNVDQIRRWSAISFSFSKYFEPSISAISYTISTQRCSKILQQNV